MRTNVLVFHLKITKLLQNFHRNILQPPPPTKSPNKQKLEKNPTKPKKNPTKQTNNQTQKTNSQKSPCMFLKFGKSEFGLSRVMPELQVPQEEPATLSSVHRKRNKLEMMLNYGKKGNCVWVLPRLWVLQCPCLAWQSCSQMCTEFLGSTSEEDVMYFLCLKMTAFN